MRSDRVATPEVKMLAKLATSVGHEEGWQCALEAVANGIGEINDAMPDTSKSHLVPWLYRRLAELVAELKEQGFTPDDEDEPIDDDLAPPVSGQGFPLPDNDAWKV